MKNSVIFSFTEPGRFGDVRNPCAGVEEGCLIKFATPEDMPALLISLEEAGAEIPTEPLR